MRQPGVPTSLALQHQRVERWTAVVIPARHGDTPSGPPVRGVLWALPVLLLCLQQHIEAAGPGGEEVLENAGRDLLQAHLAGAHRLVRGAQDVLFRQLQLWPVEPF